MDNGAGTSGFTNCIFSGNRTQQVGGVINNNAGASTFNQCVMVNNATTSGANSGGGAIHVSTGSSTLNDCTLYNNTTASTAQPNGNAITIDAAGTANLNNTIVWGTATNQIAVNGTLNKAYSDIRGIAAAGTNISVDPQFINPTNPIGADAAWATIDDGLRLTPCSPAINAGSNALIPAGITTDITGAVRIQQTTVDIGAYEMPYSSTGLPSTTIAMSPANPVCASTSVTFTATTIAPGTGPSYQWYKNNAPVGTNAATYTVTGWVAGDVVTVVHTNNDCNLKDTAASITVVVTPMPALPVLSLATRQYAPALLTLIPSLRSAALPPRPGRCLQAGMAAAALHPSMLLPAAQAVTLPYLQ